ncbi:MAG: NAD(P)-binding protein [Fusobacteriaceae bacterium]
MSRLSIGAFNEAQLTVEKFYKELEKRIAASPPGLCPVDITSAFLQLCHVQSCGKCVPCRIGLGQLKNLVDDILKGEATLSTLKLIETTAKNIYYTSDCAIGSEAANMVLNGLKGYNEEFTQHIIGGKCTCEIKQSIPCIALCPAGVDIPGYIALISEERYEEAIKLIKKDNPLPSVCAMVCEKPCEARCRRKTIDDSVNIKELKRVATDNAKEVEPPINAPATDKSVAIIGGGAGGLSAAYYLKLMGHSVTIYEQRNKLGGMLRYGIPNYRLPRNILDKELKYILATGIDVKTDVSIGKDYSFEYLKNNFNAVYISIGAHAYKSLGIKGEDAIGVIPALSMLKEIGDNKIPDFTGKNILVIGGGNVAMDVARSSIRAKSKSVKVIYRRRIEDMTALKEEVHGAVEEGVEIITLASPVKINENNENKVISLTIKPQMIGPIQNGRPKPINSEKPEEDILCDIIIIAIGQEIETESFSKHGIPINKGTIDALDWSGFKNSPGIFAGGDCVTGPATVIRAISAGKVAAANIDNYLGFNHIIECDIKIPKPKLTDKIPCGRVNIKNRATKERILDFDQVEIRMSKEESIQEANRCLRCDHFGLGIFKGGRTKQW